MTTQEALKLLDITAPISRELLNETYEQMSTVWNPDNFQGMEGLSEKATAKLNQLYEAYLYLYELPDDGYPYQVNDVSAPSVQEPLRRAKPSLPTLPPEVPRVREGGGLYGMVDLSAPFMRRVGAFVIDVAVGLVGWLGYLFFKEYRAIQEMAATGKNLSAPEAMTSGFWLMVAVFVWLYFVVMEFFLQGSVGKLVMKLVVTDMQGKPAGLEKVGLRAAGMLACFFFPPLYLACKWTRNRQCLHDLLAGCQVMWRLPAAEAQAAYEKEMGRQLSWQQIGGLLAALLIAGLARMAKDERRKSQTNYQTPYVSPARP